jgi:hypothetical protein
LSNFKELRDQAKALGINTFHMSKSAIEGALAAADAGGLEPEPVKKKGRTSWRWRNRLELDGKDPRFRYRFCSRDESNLRDRLADGWDFVNPSTCLPGEHVDPRQVADGVPLDGALTYRDLVAMAIPEELAADRDAQLREATRQQTVNLKRQAQSDAPAGAEVHGNITIIE